MPQSPTKNKRKIENPKEDWLIFENTHEPIVTQQEFDLVQEMRKNKRRNQKQETVNRFRASVSVLTAERSYTCAVQEALAKIRSI